MLSPKASISETCFATALAREVTAIAVGELRPPLRCDRAFLFYKSCWRAAPTFTLRPRLCVLQSVGHQPRTKGCISYTQSATHAQKDALAIHNQPRTKGCISYTQKHQGLMSSSSTAVNGQPKTSLATSHSRSIF